MRERRSPQEIALDTSIGRRIRTVREFRKLSQRELSERCGYEQSWLQRIECGRSRVTIYNLYLIAHQLAVLPTKLMPQPDEVL